jgi:hypothetical protein
MGLLLLRMVIVLVAPQLVGVVWRRQPVSALIR